MEVKLKLIIMEKQYLKTIGLGNRLHYCLLLALFSLISCSRKDEFDMLLINVTEEYPILSNYKWKILSAWKDESIKKLEAQAENGDTLVSLSIIQFKKNFNKNMEDSVVFESFLKTYSIDEYKHVTSVNESGKVLYTYRYRADDELQRKEFIYGKYRFLFEETAMPADQINYYLLNRDSLDQIPGDNLPPLPSDG